MQAISAEQFDSYVSVYDMISTSRLCMTVSLALLIWDWLCTIPLEVKHIWKSKRLASFVNIIFLINRYMSMVTLSITLWMLYIPYGRTDLCKRVHLLGPYLSIITYLSASIIVIVRVYAIWERSKVVLAVLCAILVAQLALQLWTPAKAEVGILPPGIDGCVPKDINRYSFLYYASMLAFDTCALALCLTRTARLYLRNGISALTFVLLRDQILFFALTFAAALVNLIHFVRKGGQYHNPGLFSALTLAMVSISANRILLNLRSVTIEESSSNDASFKILPPGRRSRTSGQHVLSYPCSPMSPLSQTLQPKDSRQTISEKQVQQQYEHELKSYT